MKLKEMPEEWKPEIIIDLLKVVKLYYTNYTHINNKFIINLNKNINEDELDIIIMSNMFTSINNIIKKYNKNPMHYKRFFKTEFEYNKDNTLTIEY